MSDTKILHRKRSFIGLQRQKNAARAPFQSVSKGKLCKSQRFIGLQRQKKSPRERRSNPSQKANFAKVGTLSACKDKKIAARAPFQSVSKGKLRKSQHFIGLQRQKNRRAWRRMIGSSRRREIVVTRQKASPSEMWRGR